MSALNRPIRQWAGLRVWIIGAGSGIGEALTKRLQGSGARVALSGRREAPLQLLARNEDLVLPMDVVSQKQVASAWRELELGWGGIDLVVFSAGVYTPMSSWELDLSLVNETIDVNLRGVYHVVSVLLPSMLNDRRGQICLIASVAGYTGLPRAAAYGPTKAALINLAQLLYTELSSKGVGVSLVNPGFVATRLTRKNEFSMPALMQPDEAAQEIMKGLQKGQFEIHFPKRFTLMLRWLSHLPDRLRFGLLKRVIGR